MHGEESITNPQRKALAVGQKLKALLSSRNFESIFDTSDEAVVEENEQSFDALLAQLKQIAPSGGTDATFTEPNAAARDGYGDSQSRSSPSSVVAEDDRKASKKTKKKKTKSNGKPKGNRDTDDDVFEEFMALAEQDNQKLEECIEHRRHKVEEFKELLRENNALLSGSEEKTNASENAQKNFEVLGNMSTSLAGLDAATTVKFCAIAMYMHLLYTKYPAKAPLCFTHNDRTMVVSESIRKTSAQIIETLLKVVLQNELDTRKSLFDELVTEDDRGFLRSASGDIGPLCPAKASAFEQNYVDFRAKHILHELIWDHTYCVRNCEEVTQLWSNDRERRGVAQILLQGFWDDMNRNLKPEFAETTLA